MTALPATCTLHPRISDEALYAAICRLAGFGRVSFDDLYRLDWDNAHADLLPEDSTLPRRLSAQGLESWLGRLVGKGWIEGKRGSGYGVTGQRRVRARWKVVP
jgi:hypothetical protein